MADEEKLATLKIMLEEADEDSRMLDDGQLRLLLEQCGGDLRRAAYRGALLKARCDGLRLPDGVSVDSNRDYWLTVARAYRTNATTLAERPFS